MENVSIPIFRAEIIEERRDKEYKDGFITEINNINYVIGNYTKGLLEVEVNNQTRFFPIKKETLSIHFPNMLDKEGTKTFCSLNASGKGGDICESEYYTRTAIYRDGMFYLKEGHILAGELFQEILVVGIQR